MRACSPRAGGRGGKGKGVRFAVPCRAVPCHAMPCCAVLCCALCRTGREGQRLGSAPARGCSQPAPSPSLPSPPTQPARAPTFISLLRSCSAVASCLACTRTHGTAAAHACVAVHLAAAPAWCCFNITPPNTQRQRKPRPGHAAATPPPSAAAAPGTATPCAAPQSLCSAC